MVQIKELIFLQTINELKIRAVSSIVEYCIDIAGVVGA
jgi:hypothetical protein